MDKIIYALWRYEDLSPATFNAAVLTCLPAALTAAGSSQIRINLRDQTVAPAADLVQSWQAPQQDAVVQLWLPCTGSVLGRSTDDVISRHCARFASWLVTEKIIIANTTYPIVQGERSPGWSQSSFITFRADLPIKAAMLHWNDYHTRIAVQTQSSFEYIQNTIVRPLSADAPGYTAFVEECFPLPAMTSAEEFFDAVGDAEKLARNTSAMRQSCEAFIDFGRIDIIPTRQFNFTGARRMVP